MNQRQLNVTCVSNKQSYTAPWRVRSVCCAILLTGSFGFLSTAAEPAVPVAAEPSPFKALEPDKAILKDKNIAAKRAAAIKGILKGEQSFATYEQQFKDYFNNYYFPWLTLNSDQALADLPKERIRFMRELSENAAKSSAAHDALIDLVLSNCTPVVQDAGFHPAVRYNMLLMVGGLNSQEAVRAGAGKATPEPYTKALPTLLEEFKRPTNTDEVKMAALLGIARHLEWDDVRPQATRMPVAMKQELIGLLIEMGGTIQTPANRTPEGHEWFRRRAIEALGPASAIMTDPTVLAFVDKMLNDDSQPISIQVAAAAALGQMSFKAPALPKIAPTTKQLGYLGALACDREIARLEGVKSLETAKASARSGAPSGNGTMGGSASSMGMPTAGSSMASSRPVMSAMPGMSLGAGNPKGAEEIDPKAYRYDYMRRRLRAQLFAIQMGLGDKRANATKGMKANAKLPAEAKLVDDVTLKLHGLIKILESEEKRTPDELKKELRKASLLLEEITKPVTKKKPAVAAPDAAEKPAEVDPAAEVAPGEGPGEVPPPDAPAPNPSADPATEPADAAAE